MDEPSLRSSRLVIAGGLLAAIVLAAGGFLLGRTTMPRPEPVTLIPIPEPAVVPPPTEAARTLTRADILGIAARAADATASGSPVPAGVLPGVGRRFDLALPFGCEGSAVPGSTAPLHWSYDAQQQTLRIHATPIRWKAGDWGALELPDDAMPALQGFWINHPWTTAESCPQPQPMVLQSTSRMPEEGAVPTEEPTPDIPTEIAVERTLAIAEFLPDEARPARRGDRPYEIVKRMDPSGFDPKQGFRLRLRGRIERLPTGETVKCTQRGGIEQRPACVVAMSLNEVRIENPLTGEVLATWTMHLEDRTSP